MKTRFLFFILLVASLQISVNTYAKVLSSGDRIELRDRKHAGTHRSIPLLPTAFIGDSLLSIDFPSIVSSVTITVKDAETGEIIYLSTELNATALQVDLSGESAGKYTLEISFGETILSGDFIL